MARWQIVVKKSEAPDLPLKQFQYSSDSQWHSLETSMAFTSSHKTQALKFIYFKSKKQKHVIAEGYLSHSTSIICSSTDEELNCWPLLQQTDGCNYMQSSRQPPPTHGKYVFPTDGVGGSLEIANRAPEMSCLIKHVEGRQFRL